MKIEKIQEYSEIYLQSYLYTMEQTKNQDLAVAVAMGVLCSIRTLDNTQQKRRGKNGKSIRGIYSSNHAGSRRKRFERRRR